MNTESPTPLSRAQVFGFLGGYFFLQFLTRTLLSGGLQMDEAEQVLLAQEWRWGYGSQGPLYTWLQALLFLPFGPTVGALALLKNTLLFGAYLCAYLGAREVLRRESHALLASVSLLFIPHLAWESQRDQTHLVLATTLSAATIFVLLRLVRTRQAIWYVLLGMAAGAGIMAKYNFTFLVLGLLLAALTRSESRAALASWRSALALAALLAVTGPHLVWALRNPELLTSQSHKFGMAAAANTAPAWVFGLGNLLKGVAEYTVVPAIFVLFLWRAPRSTEPDIADRSLARLLLRTMVLALALCAVAVVVFGVTNVKSRWLQPLLVPLPILLVYAGRERLTPARQRALCFAAVAAAAAVLVAVNGTVLGAKWLQRPNNVNVAFDELARQIREGGFSRGSLLSNDQRVAGNLRKEFPESVALVPAMDYFTRPAGQPTLVVWDATKTPNPSAELVQFATRLLGTWPTNPPPRVIAAPGRRGDPRTSRLAFILLPGRELPGR